MQLTSKAIRPVLAASVLIAGLAACTEKADVNAPAIEEIHWVAPAPYCAFLPEGSEFDFSDTSTWKFLFITVPEADAEAETAPAHMQIDGTKTKLIRNLDAEGAGYRTWIYDAVESDIVVEIKLESGAAEAGAKTGILQSGTIRLREPTRSPALAIVGGCGL